jgi:hypothetical protein
MSENVVSLHGGDIANARRQAFVQAVAASFDLYVEAYGHEPDAIVYVLCGLKQPSRIAWDIHGDSMGGPTSILSIATVHCQAEAAASRQGIED